MADKMMFEHRGSGGVVEYLGTTMGRTPYTSETGVFVRVACECGEEHGIELEDFLRNFEFIPKIKTMELSAPIDDPVWAEIEAVARKHGFDPEEVGEDEIEEMMDEFDREFGEPVGTG